MKLRHLPLALFVLIQLGCEKRDSGNDFPPLDTVITASGDRLVVVEASQILPGFNYKSHGHEFVICTQESRVAYISSRSKGFEPTPRVKLFETKFKELG
ncbi:MAG: hypothetical protein AAF802_11790, partial [Planctomycetota bacterium]